MRSHHPDAGTGWSEYNADYIIEGGTSMATPLTAGAAALVREWLVRIKKVANPSAALMKSVLINGAADMSPGQYGSGPAQEIPSQRPNNVSGWGRVDPRRLDPAAPRKIWFTDNTSGLSTGQAATYRVTVSAGNATQQNRRRTSARRPPHSWCRTAASRPAASRLGTHLAGPQIDNSAWHSGTRSAQFGRY